MGEAGKVLWAHDRGFAPSKDGGEDPAVAGCLQGDLFVLQVMWEA